MFAVIKNKINMKKTAILQLLLWFSVPSLHAQKNFWTICSKLPILEQGIRTNTVLQGFNWVEVKDSFFVSITGVAANSKNVMLGWVGEDLGKGLYKSINGGKTWEKVVPKVPLLPDTTVLQRLRHSAAFRAEDEQLYLNRLKRSRDIITSMFAFGEDFYMVNGGQQNRVLFRSKDLGKTWKEISFLEMSSHIDAKNNKLIKVENVADIRNSTFMGDNALIFSESQDSGRTWIKNFEGRSDVGFIYSDKTFSIDTKYSSLFYRYKKENIWYKEDLFNARKKDTITGEVYQASIKLIYKGTNSATLFSLVEPRGWLNSVIPDVNTLDLCKSTDGGLTWNVVSKVTISNYGGIHFIDCNNVIYASLASPVNGFCRSSDGGRSWEVLSGLPRNPIIGSVMLMPDDYLYYVGEKYFYRSLEKTCSSIPSNDPCALEGDKIDYSVNVVPIAQPNISTCWAACAAMMYYWKKNNIKNGSISDALYEIEGGRFKYYQTFLISDDIQWTPFTDGSISCLGDGEPEQLYLKLMGLVKLDNSLSISQLNNYLLQHGPILMLRRYGCPNPKYKECHAMLMVGIHSNGIPECTTFDVIDPWAWDNSGKPIQVVERSWSFKDLFECQWDLIAYPSGKKSLDKKVNAKSDEKIGTSSLEKKIELPSTSQFEITNGTFENNTGWTYSGGIVTFKHKNATLQTEKKKMPVVLKCQKFQVPTNANNLTFKLDKTSVGEAEFKVFLLSSSSKSEILKEKISQSIANINKGIGILNKALEGNLPQKEKQEDKFIDVKVDISKYRGQAVELEFSYETLGIGKPKLIIDDVRIE